MVFSRSFTPVIVTVVVSLVGCSPWTQAELARARQAALAAQEEALRSRALAEQARAAAEAEAARARAEADTTSAEAATSDGGAGLRVWRDAEADELCELLGIEADCFKFQGGAIACWLEIEIDGKTTRWDEEESDLGGTTSPTEPPKGQPSQVLSGSIVWVRRSDNDQESWQLAIQRRAGGATQGQDRRSSKTLVPPTGPPRPGAPRLQRLIPGEAKTSLTRDEEATLVTLQTVGESESEISRTVKLKCKALE